MAGFELPRHLSAIDHAFLTVETTSSAPMHICVLATYRLPLDATDDATAEDVAGGGGDEPIDVVRRGLIRLLPDLPHLRRRLLPSLPGAPRVYWGRPGPIDIDAHLHGLALSGSGSEQELLDAAAALHARKLSRSRPLWEVWVITGLDRLDPESTEPGQRFGVLLKAHHAAVDGLTGMAVFAGLHGRRPFDPGGASNTNLNPPARTLGSAPPTAPVEVPPAAPEFDEAGAARRADVADQNRRAALTRETSALSAVRAITGEGIGVAIGPLRSAARITRALSHRRSRPRAGDPALLLPWTRLNGTVSAERCIVSIRFAAEDVRRVRAAVAGSTPNDVVLAALGGALGQWLAAPTVDGEERAEGEQAVDVVAGVPIVRKRGTAEAPGNSFDLLRIPLGLAAADPVRRLEAITAATSAAKRNPGQAAELNDSAELVPGWLLGLAIQGAPALHRLGLPLPAVHSIVTNVAGPRFPLYLERAELISVQALGPITNGLAVFHAITSYRSEVVLTVTSSPSVLADADDYAKRIEVAFGQLLEAAAL